MDRIAAAPISWGACEIPDWGDQLPYARVLDEMSTAGYAGTELGPPGYLPRDAGPLRRELSSRSLALVGAFCPVTAHRPEDRDEALRVAHETAALLAETGKGVLVLAEAGDEGRARLAGRVPPDGSGSFDEDAWTRFCETANEIAHRARGRGVATAFHPHAGSYVESPPEIARLLAGTAKDLVGLCLDTGHVAYGGGDPAALAREAGPRVRHVHLKDLRADVRARAIARGATFREAVGDGVFAPLGEGDLDLRATLGALRDAGYSGWLVVEQDTRLGLTPAADPLADARRSRAFLRQGIAA